MNKPETQPGGSLEPVGSEDFGIPQSELREMIKPLVLLMHRQKLPWIKIMLDGGIATVRSWRTSPQPGTIYEANNGDD
jgi:hypothetical protein